ncbi:MAG TPA: M48 family metallopeptidase [Candidatus Limnocylindria bacterium]|nr:M48 family metallopeptidase [Candidatus Limnocylindria bacterium]
MTSKTRYSYSIIRSARRTLCLEIRPGGVLTVRAPRRASAEEISSFVRSKEPWIERNIGQVKAAPPRATPEEEARLRRLARERLPALVARYSAVMGVSPRQVRVTGAQKRLGSCSSAGNVCFSYRLMGYPHSVVEYIVVHELAHLREMNHSPAFYRVVERVLPDWRARRALIKQGPPGTSEA